MNGCPNDAKLLAYLDGETPAAEIEAHLTECAGCRKQLESIRGALAEVDGLLSQLSEMPPRAAGTPAVARKPMTLKRVAAGAAIAACVSFASFLVRQSPPPYRVARFVALDSRQDPIEFGTVVRMSVPVSLLDPSVMAGDSRKVQAEVLLGDDGRPRAVRFLD